MFQPPCTLGVMIIPQVQCSCGMRSKSRGSILREGTSHIYTVRLYIYIYIYVCVCVCVCVCVFQVCRLLTELDRKTELTHLTK